ncbi:MAG: acetylglutamate kinase [bacterium]
MEKEFAAKRAAALIESLPYIREFFGKTIVIKLGGSIMADDNLMSNLASNIVLLKYVGMNPVIIHGGGAEINIWLAKWGKKKEFIDGIRVTDVETMDVVEMVLVGRINKEIVSLINVHGGKAVGLCGKDAKMIKAKKRMYKKDGKKVDLGMVGDIDTIDPDLIDILAHGMYIPVIAPVSSGSRGETYNINADDVAGKIAIGMCAEKLILLTDVSGVLDLHGNLIESLSHEEVKELINKNVIKGGMLPKIQCCLNALQGGVRKAHIIDGRIDHAILLEIFTDRGVGTVLINERM